MAGKKLGPLLLSGLMIGPILGSGIIILPPLVYEVAGAWALPAWMVIVTVSFFFASIFGRLSILFPGDAGVMNAIEEAFGTRVKQLASLYLVGAVLFGPVAVMLTAASYLQFALALPLALIALPLLLFCTCLLLLQVTSIGRISLVISTVVVIVLFSGGLAVLLLHHRPVAPLPPFEPQQFGYGLLLLFWTVVGWEVVGNYSGEIRKPETTIPRAVTVSVLLMAAVSLTVAAAIQTVSPDMVGNRLNVAVVIRPLFGPASDAVMAVLAAGLCVTSYLLFTGAVARLLASLAGDGFLPALLARRSRTGAPAAAVLILTVVHLGVLAAVYLGIADIEKLVALADGFFIANALAGILAAVRLLEQGLLRTAAAVLGVIFCLILLHAATAVIVLVVLAAIFFCLPYFSRHTR
jgi:APA family basic amino acid/polyamine antiporter